MSLDSGARGLARRGLGNVTQDAIDAAAASTAQATLAGHYANDAVDADVPGGPAGSRGAQWWATKAASFAATLSSTISSVAALVSQVGVFRQTALPVEASDDLLVWQTSNNDVLGRFDKDGVFIPGQFVAPNGSITASALNATLAALVAQGLPSEFGDRFEWLLGGNLLMELNPDDGLVPGKATLPAQATFLSDNLALPLGSRLAAGGAFAGRAHADYFVQMYVDGGGKQQLRTWRLSDGVGPFNITSGGDHKRDPSVTDDGYILCIDDTSGPMLIHAETGAPRSLFPNTAAIAGVGDSKTAGGSGYFDTLTPLYTGRSTYNLGVGSQKIDQVLVRHNWLAASLTIAGSAIPTSGSVKATPSIRFLDGAGGTRGTRIIIAGVTCAIIWDGVTNSDYDLTPIAYPGSPVAASGAVPFTVDGTLTGATVTVAACAALPSLASALGGYIAFRVWRNDVGAGDLATIPPLLDKIAAGFKRQSLMRHLVIVGETNAPGDSDANVVWLANANAQTKARFPNNFIDLQALYAAAGYTTSRVIGGVTYQVSTAAIMGGDGFHDNAVGWAICSNAVKAMADSKGY